MIPSSITILVVEDEQRLRDLVCGYLEREGFTTLPAADGFAALHLARQHTPDLVVLDLMLPGLMAWRSAGACAPSPMPT